MGMGFAPTWLRQVSPPLLLHKTTLTTESLLILPVRYHNREAGESARDSLQRLFITEGLAKY